MNDRAADKRATHHFLEHVIDLLLLRRGNPRKKGFHESLLSCERKLKIFKDSELLEDGRLLKLPADTGLRDLGFGHLQQIQVASKPCGAGIGTGFSRDDVHHRGLARTIGADNATQLAGFDVEGELVQGLETVEADSELFEIENLVPDGHFLLRLGIKPTTPRGRNTVTRTNNNPSA